MHAYTPLSLKDVRLTDGLMYRMQRLVRDKVLPYQWKVLHDAVPGAVKSHCIENFRIAAGQSQGEYYGVVFLDSDLYKWLEAAAYCVAVFPDDAELIANADEMFGLIAAAQQKDGYLNTYYTLREPNGRFTNLQEGHELYCAGHFIEAAVAYYEATGKRVGLDTACRLADYLGKVFGTGDEQMPGYPGHQEVELALVKLHRATGNDSYLKLAGYFINQRGTEPRYFEAERAKPGFKSIFHFDVMYQPPYLQAHAEPRDQREAEGHSVRALYMYSAMADLARIENDESLGAACDALYQNVTNRRMYVTGAVGSTEHGEAFTVDYDLPNDSVYGESCASVALMMFASRMAQLRNDGKYFDAVERALFNQVLGGISQTGEEFFYVGPLSVNPAFDKGNPGLAHVKTVRQRWFDVACCPTNIARTIMSIAGYAFGADGDRLLINIPLAAAIDSGHSKLNIVAEYPFGDEVKIEIRSAPKIALRQSGLAPVVRLRVNGEAREITLENGYIMLDGLKEGDVIEAKLDMAPHYVSANPRVTHDVGKAAVMRGPLIYCAESADNGENVAGLVLPNTPSFQEWLAFSDSVMIGVKGQRLTFADDDALYQNGLPKLEPSGIALIPYYLWANRGEGEMEVYLPVR